MAANSPSKEPAAVVRPLVPTGVINEFGPVELDMEYEARMGSGLDHTYVPGFSEMRVRRDKEVEEAHRGQRPWNRVFTLPVNMRWSRRTKASGNPDETKVQNARLQGYEPATKADIGKPWLERLPDGATFGPDNTILKGDAVLMVCPQQRAAQNQHRKNEATKQRLQSSMAKAESVGAVTEAKAAAGIDLGSQMKNPDA